jgi:hypothetical protein
VDRAARLRRHHRLALRPHEASRGLDQDQHGTKSECVLVALAGRRIVIQLHFIR